MKWWEESKESFIFLKWNQLGSAVDIREYILMSKYDGLRQILTSRSEEYNSLIAYPRKYEERFFHYGNQLYMKWNSTDDILYEDHLWLELLEPRRLYFFIEFPTREYRIESREVHTMYKGLFSYGPIEHHGELARQI